MMVFGTSYQEFIYSRAQTQPSHEERVWCHKPESLDVEEVLKPSHF